MIPLNGNSTTTALANGATYTGNWFDATGYNYDSVVVACKTDLAGSLYLDFSTDGTNVDSTLTWDVAAATNEVHRATITRQYFRVRFTNSGGSTQAYFRLQTIIGWNQLPLTSALNTTMQSDADAIPVRAVLHGSHDNGTFAKVPVDPFGHLEVAVHSPLLPFGSLHTERLTPVFQHDAVFGIDPVHQLTTVNASGSVTASESMFVCQSGTSVGGAGSLTSRRRIRYRPGQGIVAKFTAMFTTGVASSYQIAGVGHPEDGAYFGYVGTQFGILLGKGGVREVRTLTITTKSSTAESVTVRLNGVNFTVAVTNGASTVTTAWEIALGTYTGWYAEAIGSTVVFISASVGPKSDGTYTLTGTTVVGSFAQTKAGVALSETFIPQSSWNTDKMDGTGVSGVTADWTKLNVFKIDLQYLGAGAITFFVEAISAGSNAEWIPVHTVLYPNSNTVPSFSNPCFQFQLSAYSTGSTTNLTVKSASYSAFIEGEQRLIGNRYSFFAQNTGVGAANYQCLFSIRNTRYFGSRSNTVVVYLLSIAAAIKHTSPCAIYIFRDATLAGSPNFSQYDTASGLYWDTAATTCTITNNRQLLWSGQLGDTGNIIFEFTDLVTIQPGEMITVAAKSSTGTPSYVTASLNTREDQ